MSRSILQTLVWRMGYRLACKQIQETIFSGVNNAALEHDRNNNFWQRRSVGMSFDNGYHARWAELGRSDVLDGRCRAERFRNHGYNLGWKGEIQRLRSMGWRHAGLEKDAELMEKYYWNNISSGKTDEYYRIFEK